MGGLSPSVEVGRFLVAGSTPFGLVEQPALGKFLGFVFIKVEMSWDGSAIIVISGYCKNGHQGNESHGKAYKNPFHDLQYQGAGRVSLINMAEARSVSLLRLGRQHHLWDGLPVVKTAVVVARRGQASQGNFSGIHF